MAHSVFVGSHGALAAGRVAGALERRRRTAKLLLAFAMLALGLLAFADLSAMTMQLGDQPDGGLTIMYRFQRPAIELPSGVDMGLLTGYHEFRAHVPLPNRHCAVVSLPFASTALESPWTDHNNTFLGNIYVGISSPLSEGNGLALNAGASLPTASTSLGSEDMLVALSSDPHHLYRFVSDLLVMHLSVARDFSTTSGLYVCSEIGPDAWLPVGDSNADSELFMRYGIGAGLRKQRWECGLEFVGWWLTSSGGAPFNEASSHILSCGVQYKAKTVAPSVYLSLPTDGYSDIVDWLLGVQLAVRLK